MKIKIKLIISTVFFIMFFNVVVFANSMALDKKNLDNGIIGVKYTGDFKTQIKLTVEKGGDRYAYTILNNNYNYVPLQMGTGTYTIALNQQISGTKYKTLSAEKITVNNIDDKKMYTYSTIITYFDNSMNAIKYFKNRNERKSIDDKVSYTYQDIITNYSYDYAKINTLTANYVPYIDDMFKSKMGICYDYAAMMAGALRSEGIPTRLVMGYSPYIEVYHAWNEVFINDKWVVVDTTYDATKFQAGYKVNFEKDGSKFQVLKIY